MSVLEYITSAGGMARIGGDLPESECKQIKDFVKSFGMKLRDRALKLQIPASQLSIRQSNFLFVGKDLQHHHILFVTKTGDTAINYKDLSSYGRLDLQTIVHQLRLEAGEVVWAFSYSIQLPTSEWDSFIENEVTRYIDTTLEAQKRVSEEAAILSEIATGMEQFRKDYPEGIKTAFLMMQFEETKPHGEIVKTIKDELSEYGIVGLKADDKDYMDDLFPNIKVYMHACDFGVAIFDRITEDDFNPNVTLEVGYMFGLGKKVLLLKDKTLKTLSTDLAGKLYKPFDTTDIPKTLPKQLEKWLTDKGLIRR